jgi:uncharacterized FlgJ-related protein
MIKKLLKIILFLIGFNLVASAKEKPVNASVSIEEKVWKLINVYDIKYPDIVFAQAILESDRMRSKLFMHGNNIFGMTYPTRRRTVATSKFTKKGYARYETWMSSVEDYSIYQKYVMRKKTFTRDQYLRYLDRVYCEKGGYSKKLRKILTNYKFIFKKDMVNIHLQIIKIDSNSIKILDSI